MEWKHSPDYYCGTGKWKLGTGEEETPALFPSFPDANLVKGPITSRSISKPGLPAD